MIKNNSIFGLMVRQALAIVLISGVVGLAVNQIRTDGLPLKGDFSVESGLFSESGGSIVISLEEARSLYETGQAVFLDARPEAWYDMGHIKGAKSLPTEQAPTLIGSVLKGQPKDTALIAYCDGELCELSHDLALALLEKGFTNVRVLVNGWTLWSEAGLPVEEGRS